MESSFVRLIKKGTSTDRIQSYVFFVILGVVVLGNLVLINRENYQQNLTFIVVVGIIFGIYYWFNRYKFKPLKFWLDKFEHHPEEIVWIKPITTNHNALLVLTYAKSYQYQVYLKDGTNVTIDCPEENKKTFYRMLREHVPHAHLGYSKDVARVYSKNRSRFLQRLNEKGLLKTVIDYSL